jgi:hypothetical protein
MLIHSHNLLSLNSKYRDIINIITLYVILILALTVTHGQHSNFTISLPVSGLPFPLLAPRLSPYSILRKLHKGKSGEFYFTSSLHPPPPPLLHILRPFELLQSPHAQPRCASRLALRRTRWARTSLLILRPAGCPRSSSRRI